MRFQLAVLVALLASEIVGCAPAPVAPAAPPPPAPVCPPPPPPPVVAAVPVPPPPPPPPPPVKPAPPPAGFEDALVAASKALAAGDVATADKQITTATTLAGDDAHLAYVAARMRATRFVYAADFDKAAAALVAVIPALARHPELSDEFSAHNTMMMIRAAEGDPAAALAENDQATLCAARGTWNPEGRAKLAFQKDRWHRAYLTRMLAESRSGSAKQALVQYAQAALEDYRPIGYADSIAILDAYFAALDGKREVALAAVRRVDATKNDDLEDLYLVVVGLEVGGDAKAAEAVRRVMRRPETGVYISRSIMLRWLDLDAKGRGFTPWHAKTR